MDFRNMATVELGSITYNVTHNADGTLTLPVYSGFEIYGPDSLYGGDVATYNWTLTTIPRASTISSFNNVTLGDGIAVVISRASTSFTHTVTLVVGGTETAVGDVGTSYTFTLDQATLDEIYASIPNSTSTGMTVYVQTYNGGTPIGSPAVAYATAYVGASIIPTFTSLTSAETVTTVANLALGTNRYLQTISRPSFTINGAAGAKSSTITGYRITFNGVTYTSNPSTAGSIAGTANLTASAYVIDSRGRNSAIQNITITVVPYTAPTANTFTALRSLSNGTLDAAAGTYAKVTAVATAASVDSKNTLNYKIESRPSGGSWTTRQADTQISGVSLNVAPVYGDGTTFPITSSFEFALTIYDKFNTVTVTASFPTGIVPMSWSESGIGVGKIWEQGALDVGGDSYFGGDIYAGGAITVGSSAGVIPSTVAYNYTNGYLVDLFSSDNLWTMITVEVTGNGYGTVPVSTIFQCYHYDTVGNFIQTYQTNYGANVAAGKWLIQGGRVRLWFAQPTNYGTFSIRAYTNAGVMIPVIVSNDVEPNVTPKVACTVINTWNTWNQGPDTGMHADILDWHHATDFLAHNELTLKDLNVGRTWSTGGITLSSASDWVNLPTMKGVMVYSGSVGLPYSDIFYMVKIGVRDMSGGHGGIAFGFGTGTLYTWRCPASTDLPTWHLVG